MGLITGNFEKFIEFSNSIPVLEHILDKNKFIYFLNETLFSGIMPILSSEEVIGIKSFLTICPIIELTELKKNVLKDITNNDRSFPTKYQAESYLVSLELELAPILYAFGQLNLIDEIREKDLYPIPLSLISGRNDSDEKGNAIIEKVKELNVKPLAKMKAYTSVEKRNYHLLYSLFSYNMDCYNEYREVMLEIEDIKERRGIGVIPKRETNYCIPEKTITELHRILNGVIIESMDCADFMKCFDLNNKPQIAPLYITGKQNLMTYTLSLIEGVNDKIALSNFGIPNYYQMKKRAIPKAKRNLQHKIKTIITNSPINVTSK
jgi:hypothetical protein